MPEGHTFDADLRLIDWFYDGQKDFDGLKGECCYYNVNDLFRNMEPLSSRVEQLVFFITDS